VFTQTKHKHRTKNRINPNFFCAVSDAAVASDTENHSLCKQTLKKTFSLAEFEAGLPDFFLVYDTKTRKNVPNEYKMYQMIIKYPKSQ
jgi:hypothetical protein